MQTLKALFSTIFYLSLGVLTVVIMFAIGAVGFIFMAIGLVLFIGWLIVQLAKAKPEDLE